MPSACGAAVVAFRQGEAVTREKIGDLKIKVVRVTVIAYNNGNGWSQVPDTDQYAILINDEIEV